MSRINRTFFFDQVKQRLFGGKLRGSQVAGMTAILDEWENNHAKKDDRWLAYSLGTAYHETNMSMQAVEEGYYLGNPARVERFQKTLRYYPFYGRGLVQLTWQKNYEKMGDVFKIDLELLPDEVLKLDLSVKIMFYGMEKGSFTGKKFADYFNATKEDWKGARRIINGTDKDFLIADISKKFYSAISYTN
jgi:hypothetical protein